jgi:hypothetical protein
MISPIRPARGHIRKIHEWEQQAEQLVQSDVMLQSPNTTGKQDIFVGQKPTKIGPMPTKIAVFVGLPTKIGRRNKLDKNRIFFVGNRRK